MLSFFIPGNFGDAYYISCLLVKEGKGETVHRSWEMGTSSQMSYKLKTQSLLLCLISLTRWLCRLCNWDRRWISFMVSAIFSQWKFYIWIFRRNSEGAFIIQSLLLLRITITFLCVWKFQNFLSFGLPYWIRTHCIVGHESRWYTSKKELRKSLICRASFSAKPKIKAISKEYLERTLDIEANKKWMSCIDIYV